MLFLTDFDEHEVDAFELAAVDYRLKPVNRARLAQALERIRSMGGTTSEEPINAVSRNPHTRLKRFFVRHGKS